MSSVNLISSILFGSMPSDKKKKALQSLCERFEKRTGHDVRPDNLALDVRSQTDSPFVLSLSLDGVKTVDLFAQGIDIDICMHDNLPTVQINFTPSIVVSVASPLQLSVLIALWFEAFKTSDGHMSAVAESRGKTLTAESRKGVSWPKKSLMQAAVHSVKIEMGVGAVIVTLDVEMADIFGGALRALAGLKHDPTTVKRVSAGRFEISRQIPLTAEHGACAAFLGGDMSSRQACVKSLNYMWLLLSRSGLDPVILKALGGANLGAGATTQAELQIRSDSGRVFDREVIRFDKAKRPTVRETAELVKRAQSGDLDVLSAIEAVGRAWQAHAPM